MAKTELIKQPTKRPIRKVKFAGIAAGLLTVATYVVTAVQGEALVTEEAAINALLVLATSAVPVITSWFTKSSSADL